ncbi:MAG: hypothetical protein ACOH2F_12200 [Cellulomonas sp.]
MALEHLTVDTGAVRGLADNLATVHQSLEDAQTTTTSLSTMVGHAHLGSVVDDFSSKWDDRRRELSEQLDKLRSMSTGVADGFDAVDSELAAALTKGA